MMGRRLWSALLAAHLASACGGEVSPPGGATSSTGGTPTVCPAGQVEAPSDGCMAVGIQACADLFIEEDGLCHPAIDKCPAGTIPKLEEGCIPVGVIDCAPEFVEA